MKKMSLPLKYCLNIATWLLCLALLLTQYLNYRIVRDMHAQQLDESISLLRLNMQTMLLFPVITSDQREIVRLAERFISVDLVWKIEIKNHLGHILYHNQLEGLNADIQVKKEIIDLFDKTAPVVINNFSQSDIKHEPSNQNLISIGQVVIFYYDEKGHIIKTTFIRHGIVSTTLVISFIIVQLIISGRLNRNLHVP